MILLSVCVFVFFPYYSLLPFIFKVVMLNPQVSQQEALSQPQPKKQELSQPFQVSLTVSPVMGSHTGLKILEMLGESCT